MEIPPQKQFIIILGRSGSGKGTQAELLKGYLQSRGHKTVTHITTGGGFREFISEDNYIARLAKDVNENGKLQPEFLAVYIWSNILITTLTGEETVILDGAPRKPFEVGILHSAISFLEYAKPIVIYLDTSESIARAHVKTRGRDDDKNEEDVASRMDWFETDVLPALELYRNDPRYTLIHVNGNQTIEEVHKELIEKLEGGK